MTWTVFILLFCTYGHSDAEGAAMISPPGVATVCSGEKLELICNITGMFLNWSIAVTPEEGTVGQEFYRLLQSIGSADQTHKQIIDSTTFCFSRSSAPDSYTIALISKLIISPVRNTLNGTSVNCTDVASANSASTIVSIINLPYLDDYGSCENLTDHIDSSVLVMGGLEPAMVGSNITFSCPPGQSLSGPNMAECLESGYWFPDLGELVQEVKCTERSFEALSRDGKIAVASSVTVFEITSILFFILGFLSRHFCRKERKMAETASLTEQPQTPYYDDVVLKQLEPMELKDNVAYAQPVQS